MARRWFSRTSCTIESESIALIANDPTKVTINSKRVLTSTDVPASVSQGGVVTLDVGNVTTMTVRGVATSNITLQFSQVGNVVFMKIPAFQISAQSGAATTVNVMSTPIVYADLLPTNTKNFVVPGTNNSANTSMLLTVDTTGAVKLKLLTGAALTTTFGINECGVEWMI